jgi:putative endonuclease
MSNIQLGRDGENIAADYLCSRGMRVISRNWRCRSGEIDLVAVDGRWLVVCEVKTRRSRTAGEPVEAVTPAKVRRLRRLAGEWLDAHDSPRRAIRIDVIAVWWPTGSEPEIRHLRAVG